MSYATRVYRQRNAHAHDDMKQQPFFPKQNDSRKSGQKNAFFQAKLTVNEPGDRYEQEADAVANAIVNKQASAAPIVQQKKISSIQQMAEEPEKDKLKRIQKKTDSLKEEDKKKTASVQTKQEGAVTSGSGQASPGIKQSSAKGSALPQNTLQDMGSSFGADFTDVRIHNDREAAALNRGLQAQAFTHGSDIYFNEGKYNPETAEGKYLLAHELTHVLQQGYAAEEKDIQRQEEEESDGFSLFNEEEQETDTVVNDQEAFFNDTGPLGSLLGDIVPEQLSLPLWNTELLGITLVSPNATCLGTASPNSIIPMSICNASRFCSGDFSFKFLFHFDVDLIKRPPPFSDAAVSIALDFIPDGKKTASISKRESGKGVYNGAGAPLSLSFGSSFFFNTLTDGNLVVLANMFDPASGKTITYRDTIRCTLIPCS